MPQPDATTASVPTWPNYFVELPVLRKLDEAYEIYDRLSQRVVSSAGIFSVGILCFMVIWIANLATDFTSSSQESLLSHVWMLAFEYSLVIILSACGSIRLYRAIARKKNHFCTRMLKTPEGRSLLATAQVVDGHVLKIRNMYHAASELAKTFQVEGQFSQDIIDDDADLLRQAILNVITSEEYGYFDLHAHWEQIRTNVYEVHAKQQAYLKTHPA